MQITSFRILLLGCILLVYANPIYSADSSVTATNDKLIYLDTSLSSLRQKIQVQDLYLSLVERTNQQLSYGMNFSGAFIAALGSLFAIGSIIAGVMLFRQSREFQRRIDDAISDYRSVIDTFIEEKQIELSMKLKGLETQVPTDAETQRNIDREVKDINAMQDSLTAISKRNR